MEFEKLHAKLRRGSQAVPPPALPVKRVARRRPELDAGAWRLAAAWDGARPCRGTSWPCRRYGGRARYVRSIRAGGFASTSVCGTYEGWYRRWLKGPGLGNVCPSGGHHLMS